MPSLNWHSLVAEGGSAPETLSARRAARLVESLGWLAPWWLRPEVLRQAAQLQPAYEAYTQRPGLPTRPGGCWALFAQQSEVPALRPAFVLPLAWEPGAADDPHLPERLRELATEVRRQLPDEGGTSWVLRLARPGRERPIDLSGLNGALLGAGSAWAALAGGLLLARDGLAPSDRVWASAAWDGTYGVGRVDRLSAKLDLAAEWGAEQVFVPAQNQPEASDWRDRHGERPAVRLLVPVNRKPVPARVLEPYLDELGVEPGPDATFEACVRYHARVSRQRANEFAWRRLQGHVVERCRALLPEDCRPTHLVTVVGTEPSVVAMAPAALRVRCVLLLCKAPPEPAITRALDEVKRYLLAQGIEHSTDELTGTSVAEQEREARQVVAEFLRDVPAGQASFDLTPAFKPLSLALQAAAPAGAWLLYCHHRQGADNRVIPGSQHYDCWRKG
jgi:hypothetical protein